MFDPSYYGEGMKIVFISLLIPFLCYVLFCLIVDILIFIDDGDGKILPRFTLFGYPLQELTKRGGKKWLIPHFLIGDKEVGYVEHIVTWGCAVSVGTVFCLFVAIGWTVLLSLMSFFLVFLAVFFLRKFVRMKKMRRTL